MDALAFLCEEGVFLSLEEAGLEEHQQVGFSPTSWGLEYYNDPEACFDHH